MIKFSQDAVTEPSFGSPPPPAATSSPIADAGPGNFAPSFPSSSPEGSAPSAANSSSAMTGDDPNKIFYKALSTPSDIVNDYQLEGALKSGKSPQYIAQDIWTSYGGDKEGFDVESGRLGARSPDLMPKNAHDMKLENDLTKNSKWKRLKQGFSIKDIFQNQNSVYYLILNYIASEIKSKKLQSFRSYSWYKYAQHKHRTIN